MKGEWGGLLKCYIRFSHDCGFKKQSIHLPDFKDVDFNFRHSTHFKFAYFEIEVSFGLTWVNLQNSHFTCKFPFSVIKGELHSNS